MTRETYDILNNIFNGQTPLKRTNPKAGESEYYYFVPGQEDWTSLSEVKTVDVPSADTANPYLQSQTNSFGQAIQFAQNNMQANDGNSPTTNYSLYGNDFTHDFIDNMLSDTRFQNIMAKRTYQNEGGYANHPNDRGGPTNFGISSRWYPNEDINNLTPERASALLYRDYWLKPKINQLPDKFADIVFDDAVVQGQPTAIMNLQKALGVKADGLIGDNTLNAFNGADDNIIRRNFINNVHSVEDQYILNDPSQKVFEQGHRNRFNQY